ncbi:MAG: lipid-A-disaccharide synthase [Microscillaceae bacterium]|nr:lipid-A-disaccharide synthase [Microscillaceae bacterium]MDW8461805.1 lipid-A-disaccharide synthase [Cytophagales bacterium]
MKYYLIAGERSGDLHGANLMKQLKKLDQQAEFRFFGGEAMQQQGGTLVKHYQEVAFMGIAEVVTNLRTIWQALRFCKQDIEQYQPQALILIDYAGFNLRIAQYIKKKRLPIKIYFYISPKVWAWNTKRVRYIKENIDKMFCILPFEVDFYQKFGYFQAFYVGNPLIDAIADFVPNPYFRTHNQLSEKPIVALLPGSRKQEVAKILPVMVSVASYFPDYQFIVAGVNNLPKQLYEPYQSNYIKIIYEQTYDLLAHAHAALVTSGTATLETALWDVPQVVCYITSYVTYYFAKAVLKIPYISLVNLVAQAKIAEELIQKKCNKTNIIQHLEQILPINSPRRLTMLQNYAELKNRMGEAGASYRTAQAIWADLTTVYPY